jgi:hypothetical protein
VERPYADHKARPRFPKIDRDPQALRGLRQFSGKARISRCNLLIILEQKKLLTLAFAWRNFPPPQSQYLVFVVEKETQVLGLTVDGHCVQTVRI